MMICRMRNYCYIYNVSARYVWNVSLENIGRIRYLHFGRKASGGVPFCFSIKAATSLQWKLQKKYSPLSVPLYLKNMQGNGRFSWKQWNRQNPYRL